MDFSDFFKKAVDKIGVDKIVIIILFASLFISLLPWMGNQIFSGIDTPGHYYLCEKMLEYLQQFRISGYDSHWFGGVPLFYFYNPLPYVMVCFLHLVSFKMLSLSFCFNLVLFLSPLLFLISVYYTSNIFFQNKRINFFSFLFGFMLLFSAENVANGIGLYSAYIAGFFTNIFSWPIIIFLMGTVEKLKQTNNKKYLFLSILLFSFLILSHIFTTIFTFVLFLFYFLLNINNSQIRKNIAIIFFSSLVLTSFWWIPFLSNIQYAYETKMTSSKSILNLYSEPFFGIFLILFSFVGIIALFKNKKYFLVCSFLFCSIFLASGILSNITEFPLHYQRFWCGAALLNVFICAYGANSVIGYINRRSQKFVIYSFAFWFLFLSLYSSIMIFAINTHRLKDVKYGSEASYITDYLKKYNISGSRVLIDEIFLFDDSKNPHYFDMKFPLNNIAITRGLLIESSISSSYLEYNQNLFSYWELDQEIKQANRGTFVLDAVNPFSKKMDQKMINAIESRLKKLSFYGTKYILTNNIKNNPIVDFTNSPFNNNIAAIRQEISPYVLIEIIADSQPILAETDYEPFFFVPSNNLSFRDFSKKWYDYNYAIDCPIIYSSRNISEISVEDINKIGGYLIDVEGCPSAGDLSFWQQKGKEIIFIGLKDNCSSTYDNIHFIKKDKDIKNYYTSIYHNISEPREKAGFKKITPEILEEEHIKFSSSHGVLINYSYFPKWKSEDKNQTIFWATPSFMFVFGRGKTDLYYK